MTKIKIGIIGGSGLNNPDILKDAKPRTDVTSIFGKLSDNILEGTIEGIPCVLLARHGRNHTVLPSDVNYRANIDALKQVGCTHIIASTACGGLQEGTRPGDFVVLDQFFDRTWGRQHTFYGGTNALDGVLHTPAADPFCERTRKAFIAAAKSMPDKFEVFRKPDDANKLSAKRALYETGTGMAVNGPRFSTRFESRLFRSWNIDIVNMTLMPEVILAREAGLSYASVAIVTDYDSWKEDGRDVSVVDVLTGFKRSVSLVIELLVKTVKQIASEEWTDVIKANQDLVQNSRQDLVSAKMAD